MVPAMTDASDALPGLDSEPAGRRRVVCRECKRPLQGRTARLWELGDDCRAKLRGRTGPRLGGFDIEQETLPEA